MSVSPASNKMVSDQPGRQAERVFVQPERVWFCHDPTPIDSGSVFWSPADRAWAGGLMAALASLETLPMTTTGTVQRRVLRRQEEARRLRLWRPLP